MTSAKTHVALVCTCSAVLLCLLPSRVWSHPDLIEQIDRLSTELKQTPPNPSLYLQRAEVYRQHGQYAEALADVETAHRVGADGTLVHLARCKIYVDSNKPMEAVQEANALLAVAPSHPETLALRARCRVALQQTNEALADYSLAIRNYPHPEPDLVLERMRLQLAAGKTAKAITDLDQVLQRVGPAIQLQTAAIDCERIAKNYEAALHRVESILARMPVKEPWLLQRAEILEEASRESDAQTAYEQVIEGLKRYPSNRQAMVVNRELAERAQAGLKRVSIKMSGTIPSPLFLSHK